MMNQVSTCPRCGAPIFLLGQGEWTNGTPPAASFTCGCQAAMMEQLKRMPAAARVGLVPPVSAP